MREDKMTQYKAAPFNALKIGVRKIDRREFADGEWTFKLQWYLKFVVAFGILDYLYVDSEGDRWWMDVECGKGFATVQIHCFDGKNDIDYFYLNPAHEDDMTEVEVGGGYARKCGCCTSKKLLFRIIKAFLTGGRPYGGCKWHKFTHDNPHGEVIEWRD